MNLYNIFEGLTDPKDNPCWQNYHPVGTKEKNDKTVPNCVPNEGVGEQAPVTDTVADEKQKQYANDTAAIAQAELANKMPRMAPTDREDPKMGMQEQDEYGNPVTEHDPEVIDEVAMNPKAFAQAIEQGQAKGVLVGFEFETCIPKRSVDAWKTGAQNAQVAGYNPEDISWVEGKTTSDIIDGLNRVGRRNWEQNLNDLFKYKGSVKTATGFKSPWYHYTSWMHEQVARQREGADASQLIFKALAEFLKDPEVAQMDVRYMNNNAERAFGNPDQYNGKTFALAVLKAETDVDFSKRVAKAKLTPELAAKVTEACRKMYQWTSGPFDSRINRVGNALDTYLNGLRNSYQPGYNYRADVNEESIATFKQHFADFCRQTMGTDNLKDLLKTKWAFNGRVNNNTETLKEKLWYYVTPGAEEPASLQSQRYSRNDYMEGAEFLKANLKDLFGSNMVIFRGYHQEAKKLDRWYIEPDGSLRPNNHDYAAEVVSPPLLAAEAMTALRNWYQRAAELNLYTNSSTGLHINVSIPETLDVLKLATFVGDQHVLKMFGRENNSYARSVIRSLQSNSDLPRVGSSEFKDAEKEMKDLVKRISGDHFATVNFNGKYVSFRHAGGDYLSKAQDIANTVGRFVRAMIIAADPTAYRDEYVGKLVKMMKEPSSTGQKLPLSDIRQIASKGIPTINLDVVVIPQTADMPTQSDIDNAIAAIKRWSGEDYSSEPMITPDPAARARLLDSRGFASTTKEWMQRAPDNMFLRVTVYPTSRRELESFSDMYTSYGADRGAAIGLHYNGKKAVGVKYRELIKQDNPAFVSAVQALRGGSAKPLPLPGSKAAPTAPAPARAEKFGIWDGNGWVINGNGRVEGSPDEVQEYMNQWNLTDNSRYELRPITGDDQAQQDPNQERAYHLVNADGDMIQNYRGTLADTRRVAQSVAQRIGADVSIVDNGTTVDTLSPEYPGNTGYRVVDSSDRTIGRAFDTEEEALDLAQELANARRGTYFVNDPDGNRVGGARPDEDEYDDSNTYSFVDMNSGELLATEEYESDEEAFENAQELANIEGINVEVRNGGENDVPLRSFTPQNSDQGHTETGSYRLTTNNGDHVADYIGALSDALNAAQFHANRNREVVAVSLDGRVLGYRRPETQQQSNQSQAYYSVTDIGGRLMARGDVLRDLRVTAQALADREGTTMEIRGGADNDVIATFQPRDGQTNEGIASPGGSTTDDSTSPIHGNEADYDGEYQAMVQRVGQKAREQERKQPVDLAKLAQRLRQGDNEVDEHIVKTGGKYQLRSKHGNKNLGTYDTKAGAEKRERQVQYFKHMGEDEIMEARLYAMKKAGYDIL